MWDNRNASNARAFKKKADDHADQRVVDYLATQVRTNGAWKARDKKDGERTRAQWEDLIPQAREWLDEQNPDKQVSILHISNVSSTSATYRPWQQVSFWHTRGIWGEILEMRSSRPLAAVVPGTVDRGRKRTLDQSLWKCPQPLWYHPTENDHRRYSLIIQKQFRK